MPCGSKDGVVVYSHPPPARVAIPSAVRGVLRGALSGVLRSLAADHRDGGARVSGVWRSQTGLRPAFGFRPALDRILETSGRKHIEAAPSQEEDDRAKTLWVMDPERLAAEAPKKDCV